MPPARTSEAVWLVYARELRLAWRRWGQLVQPVVFFVIIGAVFPLALAPEPLLLQTLAPGVVWVGALLSSLLGLESLFKTDREDGTLEQLLLTGQPLSLLLLGKLLAHWCVSGWPLVIASPLVGAMLGVPAHAQATSMLALWLGTGVMSLLGGAGAALTLAAQKGSVLLSVLVLPLMIPVIIFGARATDLAMHAEDAANAVWLLASLMVLALTLAPVATAAAVRISLE